MKEVTKEHLLAALQALNVRPGDGLLVHSALQFLGRPVGGVGMYFEALCEAVGCDSFSARLDANERDVPAASPVSRTGLASSGTIAVPTFNFSFAKGEPYDPINTPSVGMGALSEYVRRLPEARRTRHPMQSLAVVGAFSDDLVSRDTPGAFDAGSAFERMLELDFKILLLGADIDAISLIHYSEQRLNAPYRYWKDFTGRVKGSTGWEKRIYRMYVRDMALDPKLTLHPVRDYLQTCGQYFSVALNYGQVGLIRMIDFVRAVDLFLSEDPYSLILNRGELGIEK